MDIYLLLCCYAVPVLVLLSLISYSLRSNNRPTLNASIAGLVESAGFLEYVDAVLLGNQMIQNYDANNNALTWPRIGVLKVINGFWIGI